MIAPTRIQRRYDHRLQALVKNAKSIVFLATLALDDSKWRVLAHVCPECRGNLQCNKKVEPPVTDALPGSTLGLRVLVLSAWLHFALGNTLGQIVEVFNFHLQMKITPGGLIQMWYRLQELLFEWYQQIHTEAIQSAVLHGDETGWRVDGKTNWLWCFSNADTTF